MEMERIHRGLPEEIQAATQWAGASGSLPQHERFRGAHAGGSGLGALGVNVRAHHRHGQSLGAPAGQFHWASTLWHEMSHVFTLTMTNSRVPRWFTEGIAVHEETAVSKEWGDRLAPEEIAAIKDKTLLPVAELDRGFIHPKSRRQVGVSYFQAGRICDYITDKFGWETILAMLHDYAADEDTPAVIRKELKMAPEEFDRRFFAFVEADTKTTRGPFQRLENAHQESQRDVEGQGLGRRD